MRLKDSDETAIHSRPTPITLLFLERLHLSHYLEFFQVHYVYWSSQRKQHVKMAKFFTQAVFEQLQQPVILKILF